MQTYWKSHFWPQFWDGKACKRCKEIVEIIFPTPALGSVSLQMMQKVVDIKFMVQSGGRSAYEHFKSCGNHIFPTLALGSESLQMQKNSGNLHLWTRRWGWKACKRCNKNTKKTFVGPQSSKLGSESLQTLKPSCESPFWLQRRGRKSCKHVSN